MAFVSGDCWFVQLVHLGWLACGWLALHRRLLGAMLRDVNRIISLRRTWPMLHEIISWERVRELLESNEKDVA